MKIKMPLSQRKKNYTNAYHIYLLLVDYEYEFSSFTIMIGYKLIKTLALDYPMFQFLIIEKHVGIHAIAFH